MDEKIAQAEVLVDVILEQGFSVNVAISNLHGTADVDWTDCYTRRCKPLQNDFDQKECKGQCQWSSYNVLITRLNALRGRCAQTSNPAGCIKTLQNSVDAAREKQRNVRKQIDEIRRAAADFRRKEARRV
jgi:hypothetical protein